MFGDLAGMEFKATLDTRGERDATDSLIRDITKNTLAFGIDKIPFHEILVKKIPVAMANVINEGWGLTKAYYVSKLLDNWAAGFETRVQVATGARSDFVLRQKYDMACLLYEAGYPTSDPPAELISESTGNLKTYDELLAGAKKDAGEGEKWEEALRKKLTPYERWLDGNGLLDRKIEDASDFQANESAKEDLRIWG